MEPPGTDEYFFDGALDEVRIYNRVLSAEEVKALSGIAGDSTTTTWTVEQMPSKFGGDATWVDEGSGVWRSGAITHGQTTWMEADVDNMTSVSFNWKVSSDSGYDFLRFYIDGVEKAKITGELNWAAVVFPLSPGKHTLKWAYTKDNIVDSGSDCGWVRDITVTYLKDQSYTVTFDANGGEGGTSETLHFGAEIAAPTVTRVGYTFAGWTPELPDTVPAEDVTYTAQWTINQYGVVFDANGGEGGVEMTLDYGAEIVAPTVTRVGYTFAGWADATGQRPVVPAATVPDGDLAYTAQWTVNQYSVAFDANGGEGGVEMTLDYGAEIVAPTVTREGWTFAGWTPELPDTVPPEDVTYVAQWSINRYGVVFDANGGEGGTSETLDYGAEIVAPMVTRVGYTFAGWADATGQWPVVPAATVPAEDVTYVAQWNANEYAVTFDANGGEVGELERIVCYDSAYGPLPALVRQDYEFAGWFTASEGGEPLAADDTHVTAGDATFYAHWRCIWLYDATADGLVITGTIYGKDVEGELAIPSQLEGVQVVEVAPGAFSGCGGVTGVRLPEGFVKVGYGAFEGCEALTDVSALPASLASLGDWDLRSLNVAGCYASDGFRICNGWVLGHENAEAEGLVIPEGVVGIAPYALSEFYDMREVVLPQSLKYIGCCAFMYDMSLGDTGALVIPDAVEVIEDGAFMMCSWIPELEIGAGLRVIGANAFEYNASLTSLKLPDSIEELGDKAFCRCLDLRYVKLPLGLSSVGEDVFDGCRALTGVSVSADGFTMGELFPSALARITDVSILAGTGEVGQGAFAGCTALAAVSIPDGVTNICERAFAGCESLSSVELPATLAAIGDSAFEGCAALVAIAIPDSVEAIGAAAFRDCASLANITLPRSLTAIPDYAFYGCSSLDSIVVPRMVASLGSYFSDSLRAVYFLCNAAPLCEADAYSAMPVDAIAYVQRGSTGWDGVPRSRYIPELWNDRAITTWTPVKFDATFDANGGMFFDESTAYACEQVKGTAYALPPYEPVWAGHVFDGWWTERSDGARITAATTVNETRAVTYYAHWRGATADVTVRFNAAGGSVEPAERSYASSRPFGTLPVPVREHYNFAGWWTIGGARIVSSSEVPAADFELFAHWSPVQYFVRYNANGGTGEMSDRSFEYGDSFSLAHCAFTAPDGMVFMGWGIVPAGPAVYADEAPFADVSAIRSGLIELYAIWATPEYAVRFDSNGGVGDMPGQTIARGVSAALDECSFTRTGFEFLGWATSPIGGVAYRDGEAVRDLPTASGDDVTLYAVWRLTSPLPEVSSDADVAVALEGGDPALSRNIRSLSEYTAYRRWMLDRTGSEEAAKTAEHAWLSFALDAQSIIKKPLENDDVEIGALAQSPDEGAFSLEVGIKDVEIGDGADPARLAQVFGIEGSASLEPGSFSSENVDVTVECPANGKVRLSAKPRPGANPARAFFMRVNVRQ